MEHLIFKILNLLKNLGGIVLIGNNIFLAGCYSPTSLTRAAISDNKTFQKRGYDKQKPIRPLGNLANLPYIEEVSFEYYNIYSNDNLQQNLVNEEYFSWLAAETKKRRLRNEKNGFTQEATPSINEYYLKKNNSANNKLNDQKYLNVLNELTTAREKFKSREVATQEDNIEDYEIKGNPYKYVKKKTISYD